MADSPFESTRVRALAVGVLTSLALSATLASARPAAAQGLVDDASSQGAQTAPRWSANAGARDVSVELGLRTGFVKDAGFDPYSTNDVINQGSLGGSLTIFRRGPLSLAVGGRWEWGAVSASARAAKAKLWTHRLSVPVEVRWQLELPLYLFARAAPGALYESATLDDGSATGTLSSAGWVASGDASLGFALLMGPWRASPRTPRWWLIGDGGYGYAAARDVKLSPEGSANDPRRYGAVELPRLALGGGFMRFAVATTF